LIRDDFPVMNKLSADLLPSPLPRKRGRCEKIDLGLFHVIPAKAGIQCFQSLANFLDPGFHWGDGVNSIFSHLRGRAGWEKRKKVTVLSFEESAKHHCKLQISN
jgi:hypothetical protein